MAEVKKPRRRLSASLEDYLEAIYHLEADRKVARSRDIAARVGVSRSSVTGALKTLAGRGLINYAPYGLVTLTAQGRSAARDVARRHDVLRTFFVDVLAVSDAEAEAAACRMEHVVSPALAERFVEFVEFVHEGADEWIERFQRFREEHRKTDLSEPAVQEKQS